KNTDPDPYLYPYNFIDSLCAPEMYGTLAWAIKKSNQDLVPSIIEFSIPGYAPSVIYLNYELPRVGWQDLTIDGTSQPNYSGEPIIILDGQNKIERGLYFTDYRVPVPPGQTYTNSNFVVKGLNIQHFLRRGILFEHAYEILVENNVITQINNNDPDYSATAIRIVGNPKVGHTDATIRNNYLGTNAQLDTTLGCDDAGILIGPDANNNLIFGNTIAYNYQAGVYVNSAIHNKISQNLIFGQNQAIQLIENGNENKAAPDSLQYNDSTQVLSGIAGPFDTIEVFGSTGAENANEYLGTTQADVSGFWSVLVSTQLQPNDTLLIVTAFDTNNNTSQLSNSVNRNTRIMPNCDCSYSNCEKVGNSNLSGTSGSGAFSNLQVSCWGALFGTPDLLGSTNQFGQYWANGSALFEMPGACVDVIQEQMYLLSYDIRKNVPLGYSNENIDFHIGLVPNANQIPSGTTIPITYGPNVQELDNITINSTTWSNHIICFEAERDFHRLFMWSIAENPPATVMTQFDNIHLIPLDAYIDDDGILVTSIEVCEGESVHLIIPCHDELTALGVENQFTWYSNPSGNNYVGVDGTVYPTQDVTYTLHGPNDCIIGTVIIKVHPNPDISFTTTDVSCYGFNDGVIDLTVIGGSSPYTFNWSNGATTEDISGLGAGNYSVTVTDDFGCTNNDNVTITEPTQLIISVTTTDETCSGSCDGSATVITSGGTPPYSYLWSSGQNTVTISNLCAGAYLVTVTDANGCSNTTIVAVNTGTVVNADFSISYSCDYPIVSEDIQFTNNSIGATSFLWDFGDGTTSTAVNPVHQFNDYGYHCITLTASYSSCQATTAQTFFIFPNDNSGGSNCFCHANFDIPDGYTIATGTTETWNQNIYLVAGDVIIENNATLVIDGILFPPTGNVVHFSPKGRIIVKQGGHLVVTNFATLTSYLDPCNNYMWQGIEVWGDPTLLSTSPAQGVVDINKSAKIKNAHIGVLLGARNMDLVCSPTDTFIYAGGVVKVQKADFLKNGIDIYFSGKINPDASANIINDGTFWCANLTTHVFEHLIDPHYNTNLYPVNHYPNANNPWAAPANQGGVSHAAIIINNQKGFDVENSNFLYKIHGITSWDAQFDVDNCIMDFVRYGINIYQLTPSLAYHHWITNSTFIRMSGYPTFPGHGIYIFGGSHDYIANNVFDNILTQNVNK
ncbi:MAG: right-handed parallel beta-helix repeat-containing protein, partial [Bacteroidales bacterium]|nr:right-handed parallel beta-helix repeat-containing protein [Bacteroidales bacterium]